jgi:2-desacetyl-2-hydroxyethyl bacteriochlorophyllide A dehydrogenase
MRAFVIDAPGTGSVHEVQVPMPGPHDVLIKIDVVGLCGTDVDLFNGTMPYFQEGLARFPLRPGHEWAGTVFEVGTQVTDFAPGDRVTGDTFVGCGDCRYCHSRRHYLCADHVEIGVRGGRDGALADYLVMPDVALHDLPDSVPATAAAFVEPGSCSLRGVKAAGVSSATTTLVWGAGTLGILAANFSRILGGHVTIVTRRPDKTRFVKGLGFDDVVTEDEMRARRFEAVIDATGSNEVPERALERVMPGGRLSLLGVPSVPVGLGVSHIVHHDLTVVGVLGGSSEIDDTIQMFATGQIDLGPLIAGRVRLEDVGTLLQSGLRAAGSAAPKFQVDFSGNETTDRSS